MSLSIKSESSLLLEYLSIIIEIDSLLIHDSSITVFKLFFDKVPTLIESITKQKSFAVKLFFDNNKLSLFILEYIDEIK